MSASSAQRGRESALLKTLGASRRQVRNGLFAEFLALGLLAGVLAASAAGLVGYALAVWIFDLSYGVNLWLWGIGIVAGTAGVGLAGLLATIPMPQSHRFTP